MGQAQNTANSKTQEKAIAKIKIRAQEKINAIFVEKSNAELKLRKEKLQKQIVYEKEMYKRLDKYAEKHSDAFKEIYKYEIDKRSRFIHTLDIELDILSDSFYNKMKAIEAERELNIEKYLQQ